MAIFSQEKNAFINSFLSLSSSLCSIDDMRSFISSLTFSTHTSFEAFVEGYDVSSVMGTDISADRETSLEWHRLSSLFKNLSASIYICVFGFGDKVAFNKM